MEACDVIVIGGGPAGAHCSDALIEAGATVTLIDGGFEAPAFMQDAPTENFEDVRIQRSDQHRWFLGADYSSIPLQGLQGGLGGGMASGNRSYAVSHTKELLPLSGHGDHIIQSLAKGGLGAIWGATCAYLNEEDLTLMGLDPAQMDAHYETVTRKIGVSGPQIRAGVQAPLKLDGHEALITEAAAGKRDRLRNLHIDVLQPHSAVLTEDMDGRKAASYSDMEYYADAGRSVWRPQYMIDRLQQHDRFRYAPQHLVDHIEQAGDETVVFAHRIENGKRGEPFASTRGELRRFRAKKVVMAAGAINTARILLRSFGLYDQRIPLVIKPHAFSALMHPRMLGRAGPRERTSLCQLMLLDTHTSANGLESACAQIYSYRSLLLFRLLSAVPLPAPEAMNLLSLFSSSLLIADIRFPGLMSTGHTLRLTRSAGSQQDHLDVDLKPEKRPEHAHSLKRLRAAFRSLGLLPLKTMDLPAGTTSHYAGTVPMSTNPSSYPLSVDGTGKLHGGDRMYVADASVFRLLPAKPHTLTIMANARRVAGEVLKRM